MHSHSPDADQGHHHDHAGTSLKTLAAMSALNIGFGVIQVIVGLILGSVVVLADAVHQAVDATGLLLALLAVSLSRRGADRQMTFGWGKADALGGYTSSLLLLGSLIWIVIESARRLLDPVAVEGGGVIVIGLLGIFVNGIGVLGLSSGSELAVRAARLHLLADLAGSVIVVLVGIVLVVSDLTWVDPVGSLIVGALVLRSTIGLLRGASDELLDRAPSGLETRDVEQLLNTRPGVTSVHHVHVRTLGKGEQSVTAHVVVDGELTVHDAQAKSESIRESLSTEFGVAHATIQLECHDCGDDSH